LGQHVVKRGSRRIGRLARLTGQGQQRIGSAPQGFQRLAAVGTMVQVLVQHRLVVGRQGSLQQHLPMPTGLLMISDRGTYSAEHVARLHRHGSYVLCSMRWDDYRAVYDAHADQLRWQQASVTLRSLG
jgi:hypothetical protein